MLTKNGIDAAIRNCKKEVTLNDGAAGHGGSLRLRLRPIADGVSAVWIAWWKKDGARNTKRMGTYPELSLADARVKFREEIRPLLLRKKNPKLVAAVPTEKPTVENMFKRYVQSLKDRDAGSAGHVEQVLLLGKYNAADALGRETLAAAVEPEDARAPLVAAVKRGAIRTADIMRTNMCAAFNWAIKSKNTYTTEENYDWGVRINPVSAIPKDPNAAKTRDRNLSAAEMSAVWRAVPDEQSGDVVRLMMLCGQRVQETVKVDGCEIDLANALWHMPKGKTKGKVRPHSFPIPPQAVAIFRRLVDLHGDGPLFPARKGSQAARMGWLAVTHTVARLDCCKAFQPRDLRRTWKSRAGEAGVDRFTRDLIQQHAKNDTGSKHYDYTDYLPMMRAAMKTWGKWMDDNVVKTQRLKIAA